VAAAGDGSRSGITCVEGGRGTEGKGMSVDDAGGRTAVYGRFVGLGPFFPRATRDDEVRGRTTKIGGEGGTRSFFLSSRDILLADLPPTPHRPHAGERGRGISTRHAGF
jgi:hypothetical protein